jgi:hypothetical protein
VTVVPPVAEKCACGVNEELAEDSGPVAVELVPFALNVYAVFSVNPVTVIGELAPVAVIEPGVEVTV